MQAVSHLTTGANGTIAQLPSPVPIRGKVSAKWNGISELVRSDSPMAKGLEEMLARVDLQGLGSIASALRQGHSCTISEKYTCGAYNLVFEIVFDDDVCWIARLRSASPMQVISQELVFESPAYKQHIMESEVATMKYVREHTTIPVPEVYAFDTTSSNPARSPYILMECIDGWRAPLRLQELSDEHLRKILDQLANVLIQLGSLQFPKIGYLYDDADGGHRIDAMLDRKGKRVGPFSSAAEYYRWRADQPLNRSNKSLVDLQDALFHSYLYQLALPFLMNGVRDKGPFPLAHNDLGVHNVLFDENWKLVGVIDWSGACVVPWESFAQFPGGAMLGPYLRKECSEMFYQSISFRQQVFLECIKRREEESNIPKSEISVHKLLGSAKTELAQCVEQYDLASLRRKYRRKLCTLLFGPEIDVELLKKSISKSELFAQGSVRVYDKGYSRKSFDLNMEYGDLRIGGNRSKER
jgi:isoamyl acetate esterase